MNVNANKWVCQNPTKTTLNENETGVHFKIKMCFFECVSGLHKQVADGVGGRSRWKVAS